MVIIQEKNLVIRYGLKHALVASASGAVGLAISGILHQSTLMIFTFSHALVWLMSFLGAAFALWMTCCRDYQVFLDNKGLHIINDGSSRSLTWDAVIHFHQPTRLRSWWGFEFRGNGKLERSDDPINKNKKRYSPEN